MASTYTALGVELMATGENAGTWGTKTNTNLNIIEQISGGFTLLKPYRRFWNNQQLLQFLMDQLVLLCLIE